MKTDLLACRHIGVNKADAEVMLRKIGVGSQNRRGKSGRTD